MAGPLDHFEISEIGATQTVNSPISGITITAKDASGITVEDFTGTNLTQTVDDGAGHTGTANIIITPVDDFYDSGIDKVEVKIRRSFAAGSIFMRLAVSLPEQQSPLQPHLEISPAAPGD